MLLPVNSLPNALNVSCIWLTLPALLRRPREIVYRRAIAVSDGNLDSHKSNANIRRKKTHVKYPYNAKVINPLTCHYDGDDDHHQDNHYRGTQLA